LRRVGREAGKMSAMESQQNVDAVNFAKQKLESQAKETQDKIGGPEQGSVVTQQVVVPSEVGKKADEVCIFTSLEALCAD
jgi:hypothetical protein